MESGKRPKAELRWLNAQSDLVQAALELADQARHEENSHRYQLVAERVATSTYQNHAIPSDSFLASSPYVVMNYGGTRTLVEMLVEDDGQLEPVRMAKLLLRSLDWKLPR